MEVVADILIVEWFPEIQLPTDLGPLTGNESDQGYDPDT